MTTKPTHIVYTPISIKDDKTFWQRVGSAWQSEKTISIKLNSLPVNGEINLFPATEKVTEESS